MNNNNNLNNYKFTHTVGREMLYMHAGFLLVCIILYFFTLCFPILQFNKNNREKVSSALIDSQVYELNDVFDSISKEVNVVADWIDNTIINDETLNSGFKNINPDKAVRKIYLYDVLNENSNINNYHLASRENFFDAWDIVHKNIKSDEFIFVDKDYLAQGYWSDLYQEDGELFVDYRRTIDDNKDGITDYLLGVKVEMNNVIPYLRLLEERVFKNAKAFLLTEDKKVYFTADYENGLNMADIYPEYHVRSEVEDYLMNGSTYIAREDADEIVYKATKLSCGLYCIVIADVSSTMDNVYLPVAHILIWFLVFFIVAEIALSVLVIKRVIEPVTVISKRIKRLSTGDSNADKDEHEQFLKLCERQDDIGETARNLDFAEKRTRSIYEYQVMKNKEAIEAKEVAETNSKTKSKFLANMSHDIRTPMNAITGMSEMLLRCDLSEQERLYVSDIKNSGENLLDLINDILDFSKVEAGSMEIVPVTYTTAKLINDAIVSNEKRINDKNLKFIVDVNSLVPKKMLGDELRLRQILNNILSNAAKYTQKGSVTLTVTGEYKRDIYLLKVYVKDTGIGIKDSDKEKLFNSYQRFDLEKNKEIQGTGLGLGIAKNMVELMNGSMVFESEYGVGSTFGFEVEQKIIDERPIGDFEEARKAIQLDIRAFTGELFAPTAKVLVCDDARINLRVAKGLMKEFGFTAKCVESGQEAIDELIANPDYDVVFMDQLMPGMDGIETLNNIRAIGGEYYTKLPIIALTANAVTGVREELLACGFNDYISKPIDMADLEAVLSDYLPKSKQQIKEKKTEEN